MNLPAYEKLGTFYLGRVVDDSGKDTAEQVLYDARDLTTHAVCVGMTGSGKTAAFVLPMIVHIMDQPELKVCAACLLCWDVTECRPASHCVSDQPAVPPAPCPCLQKGEGPIAVIVAPTRELSEQIHKEARASWPSAGCC